MKRDADIIGDFIVAEDIADFADPNLGFALSRIPGVSRVIGDGSEQDVQIRGLSQTKTLVNGRVIRSVNGGGRYIRQENVSTNILSGVAVYKTPTAEPLKVA